MPPVLRFFEGDVAVKLIGTNAFKFGEVKQDDEGELYLQWSLNDMSYISKVNLEEVALCDRKFLKGERILYNGQEGKIVEIRNLPTVISILDPCVAFRKVDESLVEDICGKYRIGSKITYQGWIGCVIRKLVTLTWTVFHPVSGQAKCTSQHEISSLSEDEDTYVGKRIERFQGNYLRNSKWENGWNIFKKLKYRNQSAVLTSKQVESVRVLWMGNIQLDGTETSLNEILPEDVIVKQQLDTRVHTLRECMNFSEGEKVAFEFTRYHQNFSTEEVRDQLLDEWFPRKFEMSSKTPLLKRRKMGIYDVGQVVPAKIWFNETEVLVHLNDGSSTVVGSKFVQKLQEDFLLSMDFILGPYPLKYRTGVYVRNIAEVEHPDSYGLLTSFSRIANAAQVNWISPKDSNAVFVSERTIPAHNIYICKEYFLLTRRNQIVVANDRAIGVVLGPVLHEGAVEVYLSSKESGGIYGQNIRRYFPHNLRMFSKKCMLDLKDSSETIIDNFPVQLYNREFGPISLRKNAASVSFSKTSKPPAMRSNFLQIQETPIDHSYFSMGSTQIVNKKFSPSLNAVNDFSKLPEGIWVDSFLDRRDLFTAAIEAPDSSILSGAVMFLDLKLSLDYPKKGSKIFATVRTAGGFDLKELFNIPVQMELDSHYDRRDNKNVFIGSDYYVAATNCSVSSIQARKFINIPEAILVVKVQTDPLDLLFGISEKDKKNFVYPLSGQMELRARNENRIAKLYEYVCTILANPPLTWKPFLQSYYHTKGPRILNRMRQYMYSIAEDKRDLSIIKSGCIDLKVLNEKKGFENALVYPWTFSFPDAMLDRVNLFLQFVEP